MSINVHCPNVNKNIANSLPHFIKYIVIQQRLLVHTALETVYSEWLQIKYSLLLSVKVPLEALEGLQKCMVQNTFAFKQRSIFYRRDANLLTEVAHIDHDLQLPAAGLCPAQEVLQASLESGHQIPERLRLWVGDAALLESLRLRHQCHGVVPPVLDDGTYVKLSHLITLMGIDESLRFLSGPLQLLQFFFFFKYLSICY